MPHRPTSSSVQHSSKAISASASSSSHSRATSSSSSSVSTKSIGVARKSSAATTTSAISVKPKNGHAATTTVSTRPAHKPAPPTAVPTSTTTAAAASSRVPQAPPPTMSTSDRRESTAWATAGAANATSTGSPTANSAAAAAATAAAAAAAANTNATPATATAAATSSTSSQRASISSKGTRIAVAPPPSTSAASAATAVATTTTTTIVLAPPEPTAAVQIVLPMADAAGTGAAATATTSSSVSTSSMVIPGAVHDDSLKPQDDSDEQPLLRVNLASNDSAATLPNPLDTTVSFPIVTGSGADSSEHTEETEETEEPKRPADAKDSKPAKATIPRTLATNADSSETFIMHVSVLHDKPLQLVSYLHARADMRRQHYTCRACYTRYGPQPKPKPGDAAEAEEGEFTEEGDSESSPSNNKDGGNGDGNKGAGAAAAAAAEHPPDLADVRAALYSFQAMEDKVDIENSWEMCPKCVCKDIAMARTQMLVMDKRSARLDESLLELSSQTRIYRLAEVPANTKPTCSKCQDAGSDPVMFQRVLKDPKADGATTDPFRFWCLPCVAQELMQMMKMRPVFHSDGTWLGQRPRYDSSLHGHRLALFDSGIPNADKSKCSHCDVEFGKVTIPWREKSRVTFDGKPVDHCRFYCTFCDFSLCTLCASRELESAGQSLRVRIAEHQPLPGCRLHSFSLRGQVSAEEWHCWQCVKQTKGPGFRCMACAKQHRAECERAEILDQPLIDRFAMCKDVCMHCTLRLLHKGSTVAELLQPLPSLPYDRSDHASSSTNKSTTFNLTVLEARGVLGLNKAHKDILSSNNKPAQRPKQKGLEDALVNLDPVKATEEYTGQPATTLSVSEGTKVSELLGRLTGKGGIFGNDDVEFGYTSPIDDVLLSGYLSSNLHDVEERILDLIGNEKASKYTDKAKRLASRMRENMRPRLWCEGDFLPNDLTLKQCDVKPSSVVYLVWECTLRKRTTDELYTIGRNRSSFCVFVRHKHSRTLIRINVKKTTLVRTVKELAARQTLKVGTDDLTSLNDDDDMANGDEAGDTNAVVALGGAGVEGKPAAAVAAHAAAGASAGVGALVNPMGSPTAALSAAAASAAAAATAASATASAADVLAAEEAKEEAIARSREENLYKLQQEALIRKTVLLHHGRVLFDGDTLHSSNVQPGDTLVLLDKVDEKDVYLHRMYSQQNWYGDMTCRERVQWNSMYDVQALWVQLQHELESIVFDERWKPQLYAAFAGMDTQRNETLDGQELCIGVHAVLHLVQERLAKVYSEDAFSDYCYETRQYRWNKFTGDEAVFMAYRDRWLEAYSEPVTGSRHIEARGLGVHVAFTEPAVFPMNQSITFDLFRRFLCDVLLECIRSHAMDVYFPEQRLVKPVLRPKHGHGGRKHALNASLALAIGSKAKEKKRAETTNAAKRSRDETREVVREHQPRSCPVDNTREEQPDDLGKQRHYTIDARDLHAHVRSQFMPALLGVLAWDLKSYQDKQSPPKRLKIDKTQASAGERLTAFLQRRRDKLRPYFLHFAQPAVLLFNLMFVSDSEEYKEWHDIDSSFGQFIWFICMFCALILYALTFYLPWLLIILYHALCARNTACVYSLLEVYTPLIISTLLAVYFVSEQSRDKTDRTNVDGETVEAAYRTAHLLVLEMAAQPIRLQQDPSAMRVKSEKPPATKPEEKGRIAQLTEKEQAYLEEVVLLVADSGHSDDQKGDDDAKRGVTFDAASDGGGKTLREALNLKSLRGSGGGGGGGAGGASGRLGPRGGGGGGVGTTGAAGRPSKNAPPAPYGIEPLLTMETYKKPPIWVREAGLEPNDIAAQRLSRQMMSERMLKQYRLGKIHMDLSFKEAVVLFLMTVVHSVVPGAYRDNNHSQYFGREWYESFFSFGTLIAVPALFQFLRFLLLACKEYMRLGVRLKNMTILANATLAQSLYSPYYIDIRNPRNLSYWLALRDEAKLVDDRLLTIVASALIFDIALLASSVIRVLLLQRGKTDLFNVISLTDMIIASLFVVGFLIIVVRANTILGVDHPQLVQRMRQSISLEMCGSETWAATSMSVDVDEQGTVDTWSEYAEFDTEEFRREREQETNEEALRLQNRITADPNAATALTARSAGLMAQQAIGTARLTARGGGIAGGVGAGGALGGGLLPTTPSMMQRGSLLGGRLNKQNSLTGGGGGGLMSMKGGGAGYWGAGTADYDDSVDDEDFDYETGASKKAACRHRTPPGTTCVACLMTHQAGYVGTQFVQLFEVLSRQSSVDSTALKVYRHDMQTKLLDSTLLHLETIDEPVKILGLTITQSLVLQMVTLALTGGLSAGWNYLSAGGGGGSSVDTTSSS